MRVERGTTLVAGILLSVAVAAQPPQRAELDLRVEGSLHVAADGTVNDFLLRTPVAPAVAKLIDQTVRRWQFKPVLVEGRPVEVSTGMHLGLTGKLLGNDQVELRIADVTFGGAKATGRLTPPRYPTEAIRAHVGGRVLMSVQIDAAGNVINAAPYRTSLDVRTGSEHEAEHFRKLLEEACTVAARQWHFEPNESLNGQPTGGSFIMPFTFFLRASGAPRPNPEDWRALIPGPVHSIAWLNGVTMPQADQLANLDDGQSVGIQSNIVLVDDVIGSVL